MASMYLKIHWMSIDRHGVQSDEMTLFFPADHVRKHSTVVQIDDEPVMRHWDDNDWADYRNTHELDSGTTKRDDGVLIAREYQGTSSYFVASRAWLLGPTGATIERLAP